MNEMMRKLGRWCMSASQLVRLPNIFIIILTQVLARYAIVSGFLGGGDTRILSGLTDFILLVVATCLIAMGGYIINDYFDVRIDRVNKPEKMSIDRFVSSRSAMVLHVILNVAGIVIGAWLGYRVRSASFALLFPFISVLLWFYSARYKRILLVGNLVVSFLSAFVVVIVWLFEFLHLRLNPGDFSEVLTNLPVVNRFILGYALFAFLVSLAREMVKDMEDVKGDMEAGCRTLPLVAGIRISKWMVALVMTITVAVLAYGHLVLSRLGMMMVVWYFLVAIDGPVLYFLFRLARAREKESFHYLGNLLKVIMLAGICSMQLIYLNS